jgi:hypothetical protein
MGVIAAGTTADTGGTGGTAMQTRITVTARGTTPVITTAITPRLRASLSALAPSALVSELAVPGLAWAVTVLGLDGGKAKSSSIRLS